MTIRHQGKRNRLTITWCLVNGIVVYVLVSFTDQYQKWKLWLDKVPIKKSGRHRSYVNHFHYAHGFHAANAPDFTPNCHSYTCDHRNTHYRKLRILLV